jgi:cell wall-associated NlpC family hydrolase
MLLLATSAHAASKLDEAVNELIGIDYKWGGTTTKGFDCSGFTMYVFEKFGISLPHTSKGQANVGTEVGKDDLKPGDLVFFNTDGKGISHVGIYLGQGEFAHASSSKGVTISNLSDAYYAKRYVTARRVMDEETFAKYAVE